MTRVENEFKQPIKQIKIRNPAHQNMTLRMRNPLLSIASIGIDTPNCVGHSALVVQQPFSRRKVQRKHRCPMLSSTVTWLPLKSSQTTQFFLEEIRIGMLKTTNCGWSDTQHKTYVFATVVFSCLIIISLGSRRVGGCPFDVVWCCLRWVRDVRVKSICLLQTPHSCAQNIYPKIKHLTSQAWGVENCKLLHPNSSNVFMISRWFYFSISYGFSDNRSSEEATWVIHLKWNLPTIYWESINSEVRLRTPILTKWNSARHGAGGATNSGCFKSPDRAMLQIWRCKPDCTRSVKW